MQPNSPPPKPRKPPSEKAIRVMALALVVTAYFAAVGLVAWGDVCPILAEHLNSRWWGGNLDEWACDQELELSESGDPLIIERVAEPSRLSDPPEPPLWKQEMDWHKQRQ